MKPHENNDPYRIPITLNLVEVQEVGPVEDEKQRVCWRLWTSEPIETIEEVWKVIEWYQQRGRIEEVHLAMKSDVKVERLCVGVRIVELRDQAEMSPDGSAENVLRPEEWRALWAFVHGEAASEEQKAPTIREVVLWIGRLGGHQNRKGDGLPGVQTLGRGLEALRLLTLGYMAYLAASPHPQPPDDTCA